MPGLEPGGDARNRHLGDVAGGGQAGPGQRRRTGRVKIDHVVRWKTEGIAHGRILSIVDVYLHCTGQHYQHRRQRGGHLPPPRRTPPVGARDPDGRDTDAQPADDRSRQHVRERPPDPADDQYGGGAQQRRPGHHRRHQAQPPRPSAPGHKEDGRRSPERRNGEGHTATEQRPVSRVRHRIRRLRPDDRTCSCALSSPACRSRRWSTFSRTQDRRERMVIGRRCWGSVAVRA
jgi:hypothetical protein